MEFNEQVFLNLDEFGEIKNIGYSEKYEMIVATFF